MASSGGGKTATTGCRWLPGKRLPLSALFWWGPLLVGWSATTLFSDFAQPRLVLEGRAENARSGGRRKAAYLVDIAGRTVKATTPDYERLKLTPYVRVEVGRGSDYIYSIEYLAN